MLRLCSQRVSENQSFSGGARAASEPDFIADRLRTLQQLPGARAARARTARARVNLRAKPLAQRGRDLVRERILKRK